MTVQQIVQQMTQQRARSTTKWFVALQSVQTTEATHHKHGEERHSRLQTHHI